MSRSIVLALSFLSGIAFLSSPSPVAAQAKYVVQPMAEMRVKQLPKGELFWRVESFQTLDKAKAAAPPYRWNPDTVSYDGLPSLTAEVAGKAWLFILGPKGGTAAGGAEVAEIGPGTLAAELYAALHGADMVRTHEPKAFRDALTIWTHIASAGF